jgi:tetratricopeptide (TPR) repeat protein/tRNA A-37 threonylcarbamoyl transferase component Bud32
LNQEHDALIGQSVGHIKVTDTLGKGGMGTVYRGYDNTLERWVALKAIRPKYRLRAQAKARFLHEARVLSQLDHPNICTVYDFVEGEKNDFLVLELIDGQSLRSALKSGVALPDAMDIAIQLLDVMALVHGQGVVHRDLKPENVMLTQTGKIKVLDFGLARSVSVITATQPMMAADEREKEDDGPHEDGPITAVYTELVPTQLGAVVGTAGYMSPEQARGEAATAASDMYSIGLILQELFTGTSPYERDVQNEVLVGRAMKGESLPVRGLSQELSQLIGRLKSLAPGGRPSALDAAERLRWIENEPRRRRRRTLVTTVWAVLVLLAAGMTMQWVRAEKEARRAEVEAIRAEREAEAAREVSDFLVSVFQVADPSSTLGETITAREILESGAQRVERELAGEPDHLARLLDVIGGVYSGLGLYDRAESLMNRAMEIRLELYEEPHPSILESRQHLAEVCMRRGEFERAVELLQPATTWEDNDQLLLAPAYGVLARAYMELADFESAEANLNVALELAGNELGDGHPDTASLLHSFAVLMQEIGRPDEAEAPRRQALDILRRSLPANDPRIATSLNNLGNYLRVKGEYDEAAELLDEALAIREQVLGPDHPSVGITLNNLALTVKNLGDFKRAETLYLRSIEIRERSMGPDHPRVANAYQNLSTLYRDIGELEKCEAASRRALEINETARGPDHPYTGIALTTLSDVLRMKGELDEAERMARRSIDIKERAYGLDHRRVASSIVALGNIYADQGDFESAEIQYLKALDIYEQALGPDHPWLAPVLTLLGGMYIDYGEIDLAEPLLRRAMAIREGAHGSDHPSNVRILIELGRIHQARGEMAEAEQCYTRGLQTARSGFGPDHVLTKEGEERYAAFLRQVKHEVAPGE